MDPGAQIDDYTGEGSSGLREAMARPHAAGRVRIIDGDTFEMQGETIRISNIDAPERAPRAKCAAEAALAEVARTELDKILGASWAGPEGSTILPTLQREGQDRYGRTLARVIGVDGDDVGETLVARNMAVRWTGRRAEWCA